MYTNSASALLLILSPAVTFAATLRSTPPSSGHAKRDLITSNNLPSPWSYLGCYSDSVSSRQLTGASYSSSSMTEQSCIAFCSNKGYTVAGLEYSQECYCDYKLGSSSVSYPNDCQMACGGDSSEACGDANRLTVFTNGQSGPSENPGVNGWESLGCYTDSGSARTLSYYAIPNQSSSMSVELCTSACGAAGYYLASVEYSGECFCGHKVDNGASVVSGDSVASGCNMVCNGAPSEFCGGANRLNLYHLPTPPPAGWTSLGCYSDSPSSRVLGVATSVPGDYNNMTIEGCLGACNAAGYKFAGVEYSRECYCDSAIQNGGALAPAPNHAAGDYGCSMFCTGDSEEICGGSGRINAYQYTG